MVQKRVPFKRRRQGLTNYSKRLKLVSSGKNRFTVRVSDKYVTCQLIKFSIKGDLTVSSFNSGMLKKFDFKGGKNLSSAYLTGLACGLLGRSKGVKEAVLDTGLKTVIKGGRIYAALKGVLDSGVKVPHDVKVLPPESRIQGEHLKIKDSFLKAENKIKEVIK